MVCARRKMPLLAVLSFEQNCHPADRMCLIGNVGLTSRQSEPANDRHPAGSKNRCFGQGNATAVAFEIPAHADAFGVVAAKTGMRPIRLFEGIDHQSRRNTVWGQPSARISKQTNNCSRMTPIIANRMIRLVFVNSTVGTWDIWTDFLNSSTFCFSDSQFYFEEATSERPTEFAAIEVPEACSPSSLILTLTLATPYQETRERVISRTSENVWAT
jgi:hypothetical protein